jgi:hypothetical protein
MILSVLNPDEGVFLKQFKKKLLLKFHSDKNKFTTDEMEKRNESVYSGPV